MVKTPPDIKLWSQYHVKMTTFLEESMTTIKKNVDKFVAGLTTNIATETDFYSIFALILNAQRLAFVLTNGRIHNQDFYKQLFKNKIAVMEENDFLDKRTNHKSSLTYCCTDYLKTAKKVVVNCNADDMDNKLQDIRAKLADYITTMHNTRNKIKVSWYLKYDGFFITDGGAYDDYRPVTFNGIQYRRIEFESTDFLGLTEVSFNINFCFLTSL